MARVTFRIAEVPAGAIRERLESPKLLVKVTCDVVKVCPLAVLVTYWGGIVSTPYILSLRGPIAPT